MDITINTVELSRALKTAGKIIGSKCTIPILENFLMEAKNGKLLITATSPNMEIMVRVSTDTSETVEEGCICVPAKKFSDLISLVKDENVKLRTSEDILKITWKKGSKNQSIINAEDYPKFLIPESDEKILIDAQGLKDSIEKVMPFCGNDSIRPALQGILIDICEDATRVVGTDSHMLRMCTLKATGTTPCQMIIGQETAGMVRNAVGKNEGDIIVTRDDKNILMCFEDTMISSRVIQYKYPKYMSIIDVNGTMDAVVDKAELISAIRRISITAEDVLVRTEPLSMLLTGENFAEGETSNEECTCTFNGETLEIKMKASIFLTGLESIDGEECVLKMKASNRAVVLVGADDTKNGSIALLMPLAHTKA